MIMRNVQPPRESFKTATASTPRRRRTTRRASDLECAIADAVLKAVALDMAGGDVTRLRYQREPDGSVSVVVLNPKRTP
jgi:hypothetical protein